MGKDHIYNIIARPNDLEETLRHTKVITQRTKCKKMNGMDSNHMLLQYQKWVCRFAFSMFHFNQILEYLMIFTLNVFFIYHHTDYYHEL